MKQLGRLYSYIVATDSGFAPCVKEGLCTLACCKPQIRCSARQGDWILGTTPKKREPGKVIYLMRVDNVLSFAQYDSHLEWRYPKRPDNIYRSIGDRLVRLNNPYHKHSSKRRDLSGKNVLLSKTFAYYGREAPSLPPGLRILCPSGRWRLIFGKGKHGSLAEERRKISALIRWARRRGWGTHGRPYDYLKKSCDCRAQRN